MGSNLKTVESIYAAFGRGDVPEILAHLRPDVVWEHDATDHGIPWLVPGRGLEHVRRFFGVVGQEFDVASFEVLSIIDGGAEVVAVCRMNATIRSTRKKLLDHEAHLWSFDRDGKVAKFKHFVDTHQHWLVSRR